MSKAYVARERETGVFECVYIRQAGDLDALGRILKNNFRDKPAVDRLMSGGEIRFIHQDTGKILREDGPGASLVVSDHQFWNMMDVHRIDRIYIYNRGAWKEYDFAGQEIDESIRKQKRFQLNPCKRFRP